MNLVLKAGSELKSSLLGGVYRSSMNANQCNCVDHDQLAWKQNYLEMNNVRG